MVVSVVVVFMGLDWVSGLAEPMALHERGRCGSGGAGEVIAKVFRLIVGYLVKCLLGADAVVVSDAGEDDALRWSGDDAEERLCDGGVGGVSVFGGGHESERVEVIS